jgi:polysaccharide export outer membrane protein
VYRIGVDDDLQISVWREPELSSTAVVRMDGKITLPLLSDVTVVGLRTDELQALLTEKLKAFVNEPQVTVVLRQIRSRKVYLFGEVIRQGTYAMSGRKTILELLADAGGIGPFAKTDGIYILRQRAGQQVRIPFNFKKALAGRSVNLQLLPGDVVVVP